MLIQGHPGKQPRELPALLWHSQHGSRGTRGLSEGWHWHCPGISAQAICRGSSSQSQNSWAKQGWDLCAGEIHPGSSAETMQLQRFFEDSQFCILSILREERFTAFSIDIFKSAVCPQGKPRTEQFQFVSRKGGEQQRGDAKAAICCLYCGSAQRPRQPRGSAFRAPPPQSPAERGQLGPSFARAGGVQPRLGSHGAPAKLLQSRNAVSDLLQAPTLQKCRSRF